MDLTKATKGQKDIITTLDAPLSVSAGAGSGKTFTLTNRIGYALLGEGVGEGSGEGRGANKGAEAGTGTGASKCADAGTGANAGSDAKTPFINSIDEVCAITFSRAGAAEMKSRIRSLLQAEGLEEQARAVENAWVTTIHGMCSRILRENALELGIDPAFEVIEDSDVSALWQQALEAVLQRWSTSGGQTRLRRLIELYPPRFTNQGPSGVAEYLTAIWEKTLALPQGFDSVRIPDTPIDLDSLLGNMYNLALQFQNISKTWEKFSKYDADYLTKLDFALDYVGKYIESTNLQEASFDQPEFDMIDYLDTLLLFPKTSNSYRAKDENAEFFAYYREMYKRSAHLAMQAAAQVISKDLLDLVRKIDLEYKALKGQGRVDNTDLLRMCYEALDANPELRKRYQQQFKLIMVDEFQDTDLLQVAIINNISRNHGQNVMTVGDAQQSIYRFRGADVEVFFRHRNEQSSHQGFKSVSLPDNFRSHADILKFVDAIFSKDTFFGDNFLSLEAKGEISKLPDPVFDKYPRVKISIIEKTGSNTVKLDQVRKEQASLIAQHFATLRDAGVSPGKMVILLGAMSNSDIYARALTEVGLESVITAGSVFANMPEVILLESLLGSLTNKANSIALYQVLESPLFNLSDGAFRAITSAPLQGAKGNSFAENFWELCAQFDKSDEESLRAPFAQAPLSPAELEELKRAISLMKAASDAIKREKPSVVIRNLLLDSGWLYRLQVLGANGLSTAANLFKALEFIEGWERENLNAFEISTNYQAFLRASKQAPGVLATPESDYVRIMTIHGSKGLEFDHVAVGEIRDGKPKSSALIADVFADNVLFLLEPKISENAKETYKGLLGFDSFTDDANLPDNFEFEGFSPVEYFNFINARIDKGELDDAQRLLYVALTRAVKSLYFSIGFSGNSKFDYSKKGMFDLLHGVLNWDKTPELTRYTFNYGGSAPAQVMHKMVTIPEEAPAEVAEEDSSFSVVNAPAVRFVDAQVASPRYNVISYSSIAPDHAPAEDDAHALDYADGHNDTHAPDSQSFTRNGVEPCRVAGTQEGSAELDADQFERELPDEAMFAEDAHLAILRHNAFALGNAFHRLGQRLIESRTTPGEVPNLPEEAFEAQISLQELSPEQAIRLRHAFNRWQASNLCARFMSHEKVAAEVPFMLDLEDCSKPLFLEGEIDGLAFDSATGSAVLIDYKTGGTEEETPDQLHAKHLLQAQCYALALMRQGFSALEANFIRVEHESANEPGQPQVVTYNFSKENSAEIEQAILEAYAARKAVC